MSDRNGIESDYCSDCRGVLLDRGELDKIIKRSSQNVQNIQHNDSRNQQFSANDSQNNYIKKKCLLGDLFDF